MRRAVILVGPGTEDSEFIYPYYRLLEAGFHVEVATKGKKDVTAKNGVPIAATVDAEAVREGDFEMAVIPGGYESPDRVRQIKPVLQLLKDFDAKGKVIAAVCHGPWVLISAGIVRGRRATCYAGMKDDLINAGAEYIDAPVVSDRNLVTAPHFRNNHDWMRETLATFERLSR